MTSCRLAALSLCLGARSRATLLRDFEALQGVGSCLQAENHLSLQVSDWFGLPGGGDRFLQRKARPIPALLLLLFLFLLSPPIY